MIQRAAIVSASLAAAIVPLGDSKSQTGTAPSLVTEANAPQALRVFAEPGDVLVENAEVSAVIRRRDGALVDFFRRKPTLPTVDQLGTLTEIDGIWELLPIAVLPEGGSLTPLTATVQLEGAGVRVQTMLENERLRIAVQLRYELLPTQPVLRVALLFSAEPEIAPDIKLGLLTRWGNLSYFVEGNPAPLLSYAGNVGWAGRRGAGGDLLLRARSPARFKAEFQSRPGFQGPLHAFLERPPAAQAAVGGTFDLAYETLRLPPIATRATGSLSIQVRDERGRAIAAKATLLPEGDPKRAVFPVDGGLSGADRFAWSGNGRILVEPPEGRYEVLVSAGPERALSRRRVVVDSRKPFDWDVTLDRVVKTPGWIAADLHLHQAGSVDADIAFDARLIAVAAEGLELAVATDHYVVTDLAPTLRSLMSSGALTQPISTIAGSEVSTLWTRFGHFNVFPLPANATIEYRDTTPTRLFAAARRASPKGVLQVNHPRWGPRLGYFSYFDLDPQTAQPRKPGFDPNFDTVEVYNGDDVRDLVKVESNLREYLRLLTGGRRYVATGSSDSHKLAFLDPGVPRTMIAHGGAKDDDADVHAPTSDVIAGLKAGNVVVTSGPFISANIGAAGPGETAYAVGSRSELEVRVLAPAWISVSRVQVLEGPGGRVLFDVQVPKSQVGGVRFERSFTLHHPQATFVVVTATGDEALPNSGRNDIRPFAFTNPIWIAP